MEKRSGSVRKQISLKLKDGGRNESSRSSKRSNNESDDFDSPVSGGVSSRKAPPSDLRWDQPIHLLGRPVSDPLLHLCEICSLPVLIYGRMKRCRHAFCHDCAKKSSGECPKCKEGDQIFEEAPMGSVYICTHGGGRYDNKGCGRSYLSQRDLDAHTLYRHNKDKPMMQQPQQPQVTLGNPLAFAVPPFFQGVQGLIRPPDMMPPQSTGGMPPRPVLPMRPGMGPRPGLPPGMALPPGMVQPPNMPPPMPGQVLHPPPPPPQGLALPPMVSAPQFIPKQNLPPNVAPPPPPPPAPWPPR